MRSNRIAALKPPYSPEIQSDFDLVMRGAPPLALFRTIARNPRVLTRMMRGGLLDRGSLSIRQREIMILRTCARCEAEYEWGVHVAIYAGKAELNAADLQTLAHGLAGKPDWEPADRLIVELADTLHATLDVDDELWARLRAHFAEDQLIELLALAGQYRTVAYYLRVLRVPREAFAPGFPPRP